MWTFLSRIQNASKASYIQRSSIALAALLLLSWLFVKTQAVNFAEHERYNRDLLRLKELDAILNQDVLKVRNGLLLYYDPLVSDLSGLKKLLNNLEKIPTFIDETGQFETKQRLKVYADMLKKKETLIESFKSQHAILKNSLSYFPIAANAVAEKATSTAENKQLATNINILLRDVLIYNLNSSDDLAPKINAQVESLLKSREQYTTIGSGDFDIAIAHAKIILNNKPQVDNLTKDLSLQPSLKRSEDLYKAYSHYYEEALKSANTYRLYLYILCIVLLGYVAYFIETLRKIVKQVKKVVVGVNISVEENDSAIRQLSDEAFKQAKEITTTLNSVEQMTLSIQEVADSARQAAEVARATSTTAETGGKAMDRTVEGFLSLRETVAETSNKVKRLGESSQQISKVVSLIDQIAMQTKLLALNASIEAARAGKEGRGFTVVAEEVRKLATQSAEATKEIQQMVQNIQRETSVVVKAMELGTTQVLEGTHLVEDAKQSLKKIVEVSHQIDQLVQSISGATVSQAQTSQEVTNLMKEIADVSKRTSDSSRQVSSSLQETVAIAQQLQESVGGFKVGT